MLHRCDPLLTRWTSASDDGQADAINRGFGETTGAIMAWLNADDLLDAGLSRIRRPLLRQTSGCRCRLRPPTADRRMRPAGSAALGVLPRHDDDTLTFVDFVPQETLFWRRTTWAAVGGRLDSSFRLRDSTGTCRLRLRACRRKDCSTSPIPRRLPSARRTEDNLLGETRPRGMCSPTRACTRTKPH